MGSTLLGGAGGGDPYIGVMPAREVIRQRGVGSLVDGAAAFVVAYLAEIGDPNALVEKLARKLTRSPH
jgi:DUF917 family protein